MGLWSPGAMLPIRGFSVGRGHVQVRSFGEFSPPALQIGDEPFAHGIGDVTVDPADTGHLMSHPFMHHHVGMTGFIQQGLVEVPQPVEHRPGDDRRVRAE
jgi:hypothetical protein